MTLKYINNSKNTKKIRTKKPLLIIVALLVLALVGYGMYEGVLKSEKVSTTTPSSDTAESTDQQINYGPPTEEEIKASEDLKEKNSESTPAPQTGANGKKVVTPVITSADANGVNAYIPAIFEESGTCTATFTHGGDVVTSNSEAFGNSNYTNCAPIRLEGALNIKGDWSVVVAYSSESSAGTSAAWQFKVE